MEVRCNRRQRREETILKSVLTANATGLSQLAAVRRPDLPNNLQLAGSFGVRLCTLCMVLGIHFL